MQPDAAITVVNGEASGSPAARRRAIGLCALVAFLDGFDTQALGPAADTIAAELAIPLAHFGLAFSAVQVGFLLGAGIFSPLGDRFGRKPLLIIATVLFAVSSLGTMQAGSLNALIAFRFLAGIGLGGAGPNFISLASDHVSSAQRARVVTMLWAAVPLGGMVASYVGGWMIPLFGWRSLFLVGGLVPLAVGALLILGLPSARGQAAMPSPGGRTSVSELFASARFKQTLWLWSASFLLWTGLIVIAFWTPALLQRTGWTVSAAATVLAFNNAGGVLGTLIVGWMLHRWRADRALLISLMASAVLVTAMGSAVADRGWMTLASFGAGFCTSAAAGTLLAVSAAAYPQSARTTGVGWALGVGRIGAILGPAGTGFLIASGWQTLTLYICFAVVFLLSGLCAFALSRRLPTPS